MDAYPHPRDQTKCRIRIYPRMMSSGSDDNTFLSALAHELFHCMQFRWGDWGSAGDWVIEGGAGFAAFDLYRSMAPPSRYQWHGWWRGSRTALSARSYDAWALWESFRQVGSDPYAGIKAIIAAGEGDVEAALQTAGMTGVWWRTLWSSKTLRSGLYPEREWQFDWPGPAPTTGPVENLVTGGTRGLGTYDVKGNGAFAQPQVNVTVTDDVGIAIVVPVYEPMTTETAKGILVVAPADPVRLCFAPDGCACPSGMSSGTLQMAERRMVFSFTAAMKRPAAKVLAIKWDPQRYCKKQPKRRASSNGDPHLTTFDGVPFDVSAMGEFVVSRDPDGGFEVQARHEPIGIGAAGTSAVALSDGAHRVTFTAPGLDPGDGDDIVLRIDGDAEDLGTSIGVDGLAIDGDAEAGWVVTWRDGSEVQLRWNRGWFVTVEPADERAGRLVGLLGAANDDPRDDLLLPDGAVFDPPLDDQAAIDDDFADAWLVDDETTLFDYEAGQSPASFAAVEPAPFTGEIPGEQTDACRTALGEDASEQEVRSCAFDVTVTDDDSFVDTYVTVVEDRVTAESGTATAAEDDTPVEPDADGAASGAPSLVLQGSLYDGLSDPGDDDAVPELTGTLDLRAGAVLVVRVALCQPDIDVTLEVTRIETSGFTSTRLCDPLGFRGVLAGPDDRVIDGEGYVLIGADGAHTITVKSDADSPIFTEVEVYADPDPLIADPHESVAEGWTGTLATIADSVTLPISTPDSILFDVATTGDVCFIELFGPEVPGDTDPWAIDVCGGGPTLGTSPTGDLVLPFVLFSRSMAPADVRVTRAS